MADAGDNGADHIVQTRLGTTAKLPIAGRVPNLRPGPHICGDPDEYDLLYHYQPKECVSLYASQRVGKGFHSSINSF